MYESQFIRAAWAIVVWAMKSRSLTGTKWKRRQRRTASRSRKINNGNNKRPAAELPKETSLPLLHHQETYLGKDQLTPSNDHAAV